MTKPGWPLATSSGSCGGSRGKTMAVNGYAIKDGHGNILAWLANAADVSVYYPHTRIYFQSITFNPAYLMNDSKFGQHGYVVFLQGQSPLNPLAWFSGQVWAQRPIEYLVAQPGGSAEAMLALFGPWEMSWTRWMRRAKTWLKSISG